MANSFVSAPIENLKGYSLKNSINTKALLERLDSCTDEAFELQEDVATMREKIVSGIEREGLRAHLSPEIYNMKTRAQNLKTFCNSLQNEIYNIERGIY